MIFRSNFGVESDAERHLQQHNPSKALFPPRHDVVTD